MNAPLTKDAQEMMKLLHYSGAADPYTLRAPLPYARALVDELRDHGVELPEPAVGGEVFLEFANNGGQLILEVY